MAVKIEFEGDADFHRLFRSLPCIKLSTIDVGRLPTVLWMTDGESHSRPSGSGLKWFCFPRDQVLQVMELLEQHYEGDSSASRAFEEALRQVLQERRQNKRRPRKAVAQKNRTGNASNDKECPVEWATWPRIGSLQQRPQRSDFSRLQEMNWSSADVVARPSSFTRRMFWPNR